jgi:DNA-binding LacI/PurR family transcriptional regulator
VTVKRVTSLDVARVAGVSQSAVSRTFSPGGSVSALTRKKILAAAVKLGYTPNAIARSLITDRTDMIGMVMGDVTNPFYPEVLQAFSVSFQEVGQRMMLFTVPPGGSIDDALPQALQYRVDGIIVTSATLSSKMIEECARLGTPVVLFNRSIRNADLSSVSCDNVEGGRFIANLLLDGGHRRCAFIAGVENTSTNVDRERGFVDRMTERGMAPLLREVGNYTYTGGYQAAMRLLSRDDRPDAIFCANDITALGAIDAARQEIGLRVPEDVSIIGFDDIPAAAWPSHDLTTVRQRINFMVDKAIDILLARIEDPELPAVTHLIPGDFVARGTVRLPPGLERGRRAISSYFRPTEPVD